MRRSFRLSRRCGGPGGEQTQNRTAEAVRASDQLGFGFKRFRDRIAVGTVLTPPGAEQCQQRIGGFGQLRTLTQAGQQRNFVRRTMVKQP